MEEHEFINEWQMKFFSASNVAFSVASLENSTSHNINNFKFKTD